MIESPRSLIQYVFVRIPLCLMLMASVCPFSFQVQSSPERTGDTQSLVIEAGDAAETLSQLARALDINLIFSAEHLRGILTRPVEVKGNPNEAVKQMIQGTSLRFFADESGSIVIFREKQHGAVSPSPKAGGNQQSVLNPNPKHPMNTSIKTNPVPKRKLFGLLLGTLVSTGAVPLNSQGDEIADTYELPPFEVNTQGDMGYLAGSTTLGGRLNTELKDTAASISVITREFLDDLGVYNFTDAAAWVPNAVSQYETEGENQFNDYNVRFRNLSVNAQARNYFTWYVNGDSYNTERIDFARGPNSVVFGTADIGGIGNISTKQAMPDLKGSLSLLTTNYGGLRATVDYNQPVTDQFFVRVNLLTEDLNGWRDYEKRGREGAHIATKWNITDKISIRAEYEYGEINRIIVGRGVFNAYDGWDRQSYVDAPKSSGSFSGGINRFGSDYLVFTPGAGQGLLNLKGLGSTSNGGNVAQMLTTPRSDIGWGSDVVIPSHEYHFFAPNTAADNPYHTYSFFLNWNPVKNFYVEAAYNAQKQERFVDQLVWQAISVDVNRVLPDGSPNPYVGEFYADSRTRVQNQWQEVSDWRISAAYKWDTDWVNSSFMVLGGKRDNSFGLDESEFLRVNGSGAQANFTNSQNRVMTRRYQSMRGVDWSVPEVDPSIARWVTWNQYETETKETYMQAAWSAEWFRSRALSTTVGIRNDKVKSYRAEDILDAVSKEVTGLEELTLRDDDSFTTKSLGAVYEITPWLSVYSGFAESWRPAGAAIDIDGRTMDPEINEGWEGGLRVNLLKGRILGSVVYYDNEKNNIRESGASSDINAIWEDLGSNNRVTDGYSDTSSQVGNGVELELVGTLTDGWNLTANIAFPEAILSNGYGQTKAYYDANVSSWTAQANAMADEAARERILQNIVDIETRILGFADGRELPDSFKYTANLFSTYRFNEGRLKGLWIGGGVNFRGERLEGIDAVGNEYWVDGYELVTATLGYQGKLNEKIRYRVQANITNLFDTEVVRASNMRDFSVNGITVFLPRNYLVLDPRRIQLTFTMMF